LGKRIRSRRLAIVGIALLVLSGASIGTSIWQRMSGFDWITLAPTGWLINRGDQSSFNGMRARNELLRRWTAGELTDSQKASILERAIPDSELADHHFVWIGFVEIGWSEQRIQANDLTRFVQAFVGNPALRVRPGVRAGQRMTIMVETVPHPWATTAEPPILEYDFEITAIEANDRDMAAEWNPRYVTELSSLAHQFRTTFALPEELDRSSPKNLTVKFSIALAPTGVLQMRSRNPWDTTPQPKPLAEWSSTVTVPISILNRQAPSPALVTNEEFSKIVRESIEFDNATADQWEDEWIPFMASSASRTPETFPGDIDVAYDIVWRAGDREWIVGGLYSENANWHWVRPAPHIRDFDPTLTKIDIILRPNPALAEELTLTTNPILDEEIIYPAVPLRVRGDR
jgi:hypothetical protein